jgi:tetratricopeptide (TPR) repeat protein
LSYRIGIAALVAFVTMAAFLPALGNGWVEQQDDRINFLQNVHFRGMGPDQVVWAFRTFLLGVYQPLAWILLEAQYATFGLAAWGYHLVSILLHAANGVLLMCVLSAVLTRSRLVGPAHDADVRASAAMAALLFSVHPLRVEVVAWASCQPYLPCAAFSLLATLAYLRSDGAEPTKRTRWMLAAMLLYLAALLYKAAALALPLTFFVLDVYPLKRFSRSAGSRGTELLRAGFEKLPMVLLGFVFLVVAFSAKYAGDPLNTTRGGGWVARVLGFGDSAYFYVQKTIWPRGLSGLYQWPEGDEPQRLALGAAGTAVLTAGLVVIRRRWPGALAAWAAYLVLLLPVSGLVRSSLGLVADRYSYLATMPLYLPVAHGLCGVMGARGGSGRGLVRFVGFAVILLFMGWSWRFCGNWRDDESVLARACSTGGISRSSYLTGLGRIRQLTGRFAEAEALYRDAAACRPPSAEAAAALGFTLAARGRFDEGLSWVDRALAIDPKYVTGYTQKGLILAERGRYAEAAEQLEEALRLNPYFVEARIDLGRVLLDQGKPAEAAEHFVRALAGDPGNPRAGRGLAEATQRAQQFGKGGRPVREPRRVPAKSS